MNKGQALWRDPRTHLFLLIPSLLLIVIPLLNKTPSQEITDKSTTAAVRFLYLVDTEEYAQSWEVSSAALKGMLSKQVWVEKIRKIRDFLGPVIERTQQGISYTDASPDVPPGEYVVITFVSRFELREYVTETITLMLNSKNQWVVAGYFMK